MPSRPTPLVTNYFYHIFNRGVSRLPIFDNKWDFKRATNLLRFYKFKDYPVRFSKFLQLSTDQRKEIWERLNSSDPYVEILSYCLMPTHFHLLLRQNLDHGISKYLANFQNSYTKYYNTKYNRLGHLLQGQFKAVKIDSEEQLLHVSRYIHLNPYSSALAAKIEDIENYEWSPLPEYISQVPFELCAKESILSNFKDLESYKKFVFDNAEYQKSLESIKHLILE